MFSPIYNIPLFIGFENIYFRLIFKHEIAMVSNTKKNEK